MRQLTAIMFTDLVGFTSLMQEDEERAKAVIDRHREVLQRYVGEHSGRILQFYGDGTLSVFPSAVNAAGAAVAIQREFNAEPLIPLRIGIHTGDIVHDDNGVYGDGVNVAARIQGLGVAGSVLLSAKVHDELKNHPKIRTRPLGEFDLKNVKQPLAILAIVAEGLTVPGLKDMPSAAETRRRSVAVLPFVNMSRHPGNEFFSDGISEDVINVLTRIDGLKVTARTSSFAFKGRNEDVRQIGRELGVSTVLEGSVRRVAGRVRVGAQLIDTHSGYHLFSEVYERSLEDIFQVQDDISNAIVEALRVHLGQLGQGTQTRMTPGESRDGEAYTEYLRGLHHCNRWTPEGVRESIGSFERAFELAGEWGAPLAMKAGALVFLGAIGYQPAGQVYPQVEAAARRALELDPTLGDAHAMLGLAQLLYHWDFEGAYGSFQRALTGNPGAARVRHSYSYYLRAIGALDEAVAELEAAHNLDPLSFPIMTELVTAYRVTGRHDDALALALEGLRLEPNFRSLKEELGWIHLQQGEVEEAIETFEELQRIAGDLYAYAGNRGLAYASSGREADARSMLDLLAEREVEHPEVGLHIDFALVHLGLGEYEDAIARLEESADERHAGVVYLWLWPHWEPLRGHPRFQALIERVRPAGRSA